MPLKPSLLIVGDELESLIAAFSAARLGLKVTLLRKSTGWLGGLSTRGGLSYMDLTPELMPPVMQRLLADCGLKRVALEPVQTDKALWQWVKTLGITVVSGTEIKPIFSRDGELESVRAVDSNQTWQADWILDTTPDADLARACGVPTLYGLGNVFGEAPELNQLGVSPVFKIAGVNREDFIAAEQALRDKPETKTLLQQVFPWLGEGKVNELKAQPVFSPAELDYIDVLNPTIGAYYHQWRFGLEVPYAKADFWMDGVNGAALSDGTIGFNGLIGRIASIDEQISLSQEKKSIPQAWLDELKQVEHFLQTVCGLKTATVIAPEALYIRQTCITQMQHNVTGREILSGGCLAEEAIGSFSYWLDFRGVHPWEAYPKQHPLPKPVFNVGLKSCFPQSPKLKKLLVLGRSAGYSPISQGACRIIQHNALLAEALTTALALGDHKTLHPSQIEPQAILQTLEKTAQALNTSYHSLCGKSVLEERPELNEWAVLARDEQVITDLAQQARS